MKQISILAILLLLIQCKPDQTVEITADELRDKIGGGIIGQFFGNLNGLEHENRYTDEPGNVTDYIPDLSDGAFTDDDTDIEFIYIYHMLKSNQIKLPYPAILDLWLENLQTDIWCSNEYAWNMMEIGFEPPYTGRIVFNPWAVFNISGQFLCEQFALISPGMPQTAARIGTHYTHVAVDGKPIQTTQLYTAMIATAFFEDEYRNTRRPGLPTDLTISDFIGLHDTMAERVILANGGQKIEINGKPGYTIVLQPPENIEPLPDPLHRINELREDWSPRIVKDLNGTAIDKARAVYAAACLGLVGEIAGADPESWEKARPEAIPFYKKSIEKQLWDDSAKEYFQDVIIHGITDPDYPFDY
jgi:hypothetical protein